MSRVHVIRETCHEVDDRRICLQWCRYLYDDGTMEHGYRFIWRGPDGKTVPARGQARLPSLAIATGLIAIAEAEGWGDHEAEDA